MALTIAVVPTYLHFEWKVQDIAGAVRTVTGYLTPHSDDNLVNEVQDNYGAMLANIEGCSAVKILSAKLQRVEEWTWTSDKTPESVQYATVDNLFALNFERANPLKPTSILNFSVPLYAYTVGEASLNFPNQSSYNSGNANVSAVVDYFTKRGTVRYSGNGLLYNGFHFVVEDTAGISVPDIIDSN